MPIYSRLQAPALSVLPSVLHHFSSLKRVIVVYEMKVCYNNNESSALVQGFVVARSLSLWSVCRERVVLLVLLCSCKLVHNAVKLLLHFVNYILVELRPAFADCIKVSRAVVEHLS
jgi:hypothetical protein